MFRICISYDGLNTVPDRDVFKLAMASFKSIPGTRCRSLTQSMVSVLANPFHQTFIARSFVSEVDAVCGGGFRSDFARNETGGQPLKSFAIARITTREIHSSLCSLSFVYG